LDLIQIELDVMQTCISISIDIMQILKSKILSGCIQNIITIGAMRTEFDFMQTEFDVIQACISIMQIF